MKQKVYVFFYKTYFNKSFTFFMPVAIQTRPYRHSANVSSTSEVLTFVHQQILITSTERSTGNSDVNNGTEN